MIQNRTITYFFKKQFENSNTIKNEAIKESIFNRQQAKTLSTVSKINSIIIPSTIEEKESIEDNLLLEKMKFESQRTRGLVVNMGLSWYKTFEKEFSKEYFQKLANFIAHQRKKGVVIYPPPQHVFTFTRMCELNQVKVVILGQDPYHKPNQAHGLSFSVRKNIPTPPSLANIFQELKSDIPDFIIPKHGTLSGWARQGVLLLNACLTVEEQKANSHRDKGWEKFTDTIIQYLNDQSSNIVFLLWGRDAQCKGSRINQKRHYVLKAAHPSPLSASNGFFNCKHFSKTNAYLKAAGLVEINWSQLPSEDELPFD
ncbi:unnamed protein product [Rotaria sordida]|uniref:Uracil-DNA glycosylase n=1 Tax=Rotaria sordida TaxID=392033 RepID=A0A815S8R6_9BILA|nr:unnamed protein product [Rotaria sordida]CAF4111913.1 unnamed protein product [Rotaria sordida]